MWNQTFEMDVKYIGDDLKIECWDYEKIGSNDLVGDTKIKLSALCTNGGIDDWFHIQYKGKDAGILHLKSVWQPLMIAAPTNPLIGAAGQAINSLAELERERMEQKAKWQAEQNERIRQEAEGRARWEEAERQRLEAERRHQEEVYAE